MITIGYAEHYFYVIKVLPILLAEMPITDPENISLVRLLLLTNMDAPYLQAISKLVLLAPLVFSFYLLKTSRTIENRHLHNHINVLAFSMFIPFTLAGMNNTLWNYQLLLALPLTAMCCLTLSNTIVAEKNVTGKKVELWLLAGLLLVLASLHITASMTVDDQFYSAKPIQILAFLLVRIFLPVVLVCFVWRTVRHTN